LIIITFKTLKAPTLYYAPERSIDELAAQLSCPKCRSRNLKSSGLYTLKCQDCGFEFNVGTLKLRKK